ncbi:hypothetical protein CAOG_07352 [Capsaspora owczarzaki ATCC 30864]|uniref:Type-1 angiotensin II receptor-associated protein n=1 Tax=Capsaspora owczarzaki (strain ATCC 30864) TaxID=595528 RepID=A0A0D2WWU0_CAPO3|nr:hypothetical protein CAOG_07352 [Capsaspora owczarzaki ATCC 30864]KJE97505.1 hypothetical protein, variant [Capsaspora owczarzaki ATCC 30864]|eukprot:XP_004343211.1 hypothetical protein CAOG_07352 [Capsaspora owczarzaki ATCC 30864]
MTFTLRVPALSLRAIVLFHTFLSIWAVLDGYLGTAYFYASFGLSMIGVWALGDQTSLEAITLYAIALVFTMLNDCITMGVYSTKDIVFNDYAPNARKFSFAMALISLLFKPISLFFALREFNRRGGSLTVPGITVSSTTNYEPIGGSPDPVSQDPNANNATPPKYDSV